MKANWFLTFFILLLSTAESFAQNETSLLDQLDTLKFSETLDNEQFNLTIHKADSKIKALEQDSTRIAGTKILRADGKTYIPKCVENNRLYLNELILLERLCQSQRLNVKVLQSLKLKFVTIYTSTEKGVAHQLILPNSDSTIWDYRYRNRDTLCLAEQANLADYPALSKYIAGGFFQVITIVPNEVMPFPTADEETDLPEVKPSERTEEYYEERSAMLGVRIKNLLSKAKNNYPNENVPTYQQYLQNESQKELNYKELASYRQNALEFLTNRYNN